MKKEKIKTRRTLKAGDEVAITGKVVSTATNAVTVEITDKDGNNGHLVTLNAAQVKDSVLKK